MILSSLITKLIFIVSFIFLVLGLYNANKKMTIDEKAKKSYNEEIAIIDSLYKSNYINESKMIKLKDDVYSKYYLNKENNLKNTKANTTDSNLK